MYDVTKKLIDWFKAVEEASRPRAHLIVRYYIIQEPTRLQEGCAFASQWWGEPGMPVETYACMN